MTRTMKDSGIEWIGEIPEDWEICRIKNVASLYTGNSIKDEYKEQYTDKCDARPYIATKDIEIVSHSVNYDNGLYVKNSDVNFEIANGGSSLLCIEGGSAGRKKAFLNREVAFVNKLCCFKPLTVHDKYLFYFICSNSFEKEFTRHISGLIGGVSVSILKNINIVIPSLSEQKKIADFLDFKCSQIDSIIEKARVSIDEYKRLKQSIITKAVTKGIRQNRPMKDSGIGWIGEIPKDWEITKIKFVANFNPQYTIKTNDNDIITFAPMECIKNGYYINQEITNPTYNNSYVPFQEGDIVLAKVTPCFENGNIAIMDGLTSGYGCGSSELFVLRPYDIDTKYLFYYLQNDSFKKMGCSTMTGTGGLKRVSPSFVRNYPIPNFTNIEQQEIVSYLDNKCSEIDKLITKKEQLIKELETYKKSLIYEYVTGKKEVV